jgi:Polymerase beta, Nucleotidyltransferase
MAQPCPEHASNLARLCQESGVDILYAFGSRACEVREWLAGQRASLSPDPADVDIGVKPGRGIHYLTANKVHLALALEEWLGVVRVDLVSLADADPFLAANIVRGERLYARDNYTADEFELYILRRAGDLAPLERERMALILGEAA